jgi:hypothetical protein
VTGDGGWTEYEAGNSPAHFPFLENAAATRDAIAAFLALS